MAREVREFAVLVPNTYLSTSPLVTDLAMPARIVREVRVRIPPGPRGEVGWALGASGQPVIPWNAGGWIIGNDETVSWPLAGQIESGAWQLLAWNTGTFSHTLYVQFLVDPPGSDRAALAGFRAPIPAAALSSG